MSFFERNKCENTISSVICRNKKFIIVTTTLWEAKECFLNYESMGIPASSLFCLYQFGSDVSLQAHKAQYVLDDTFDERAGNYGYFLASQLTSPSNLAMREALREFDETCKAYVAFNGLFSLPEVVLSRKVLFHCSGNRFRIEDKVEGTEILKKVGLLSECSIHNVTDVDAILNARAVLDKGNGVVLAFGGKWSGGAEGVVYVGSEDTAAWCRSLLPSIGLVRVMPFIKGIPVELTFVIFKDGHISVLKPEEGLTLVRSDRPSKFSFYGINSFWQPDEVASSLLKGVSIKLAKHLRDELEYLGVCNLNGILDDSNSFVATEINARVPGPRPRRVFKNELYFLDAAINSFSAEDVPSLIIDASIRQAQEDTAGVYITNFASDMKLVHLFPRTALYPCPMIHLKIDDTGDIRFCTSTETADVVFTDNTTIKIIALQRHFQTQARPLLVKCLNYICKHIPATQGPRFALTLDEL
eukprot:CAMPEP_0183791010 /NCGR_PEP_ID=MMETSP0803_2-20130417/1541_1 /TAXON_ID=195967 /ORGANISM="Crustomastix stigmata, Strain CCMP3273" /LENGTH=470 /DNA_ID=CAMNT_0026035299 /DNA_START=225 /DNA_END=1637 /DNA_ORIENTATION=-